MMKKSLFMKAALVVSLIVALAAFIVACGTTKDHYYTIDGGGDTATTKAVSGSYPVTGAKSVYVCVDDGGACDDTQAVTAAIGGDGSFTANLPVTAGTDPDVIVTVYTETKAEIDAQVNGKESVFLKRPTVAPRMVLSAPAAMRSSVSIISTAVHAKMKEAKKADPTKSVAELLSAAQKDVAQDFGFTSFAEMTSAPANVIVTISTVAEKAMNGNLALNTRKLLSVALAVIDKVQEAISSLGGNIIANIDKLPSVTITQVTPEEVAAKDEIASVNTAPGTPEPEPTPTPTPGTNDEEEVTPSTPATPTSVKEYMETLTSRHSFEVTATEEELESGVIVSPIKVDKGDYIIIKTVALANDEDTFAVVELQQPVLNVSSLIRAAVDDEEEAGDDDDEEATSEEAEDDDEEEAGEANDEEAAGEAPAPAGAPEGSFVIAGEGEAEIAAKIKVAALPVAASEGFTVKFLVFTVDGDSENAESLVASLKDVANTTSISTILDADDNEDITIQLYDATVTVSEDDPTPTPAPAGNDEEEAGDEDEGDDDTEEETAAAD